MRAFNLITLAFAAGLVVSSPVRAQTNEPVKLFVFTVPPPEGFVDKDSQQRTDSVADLRKSLSKKKGMVIVDREDGADVTLEIIGRGYEETGATTTRTTAGPYTGIVSNTNKDTQKDLAVRLAAGTYQTVLHSDTTVVLWRLHADAVAKKVERWLKDNRDTVLAKRGR